MSSLHFFFLSIDLSLLLRELVGKRGACGRARFQLRKQVLCEEVGRVGEFAYLEMLIPESTGGKGWKEDIGKGSTEQS